MLRRLAAGLLAAALTFAGAVSPTLAQQESAEATLTVDANPEQSYQISRFIYGHFAEHLGHCIYGGIWVGPESPIPNTRGIRNDVLEALRKLDIPVLRWPGGCFADEYHWMDGIGPRDQRPSMINTHWGGVVEDNSFGTHEFMDLVELLGAEAYICGNVGSGTVQEMMNWVEYMTSDADTPMTRLRKQNGREEPWRVRFWAVGNESWGCGGNMRPEYYADLYRRFNTFIKNYGENRIFRVAGGANSDDYNWTRVMMERGGQMDGLSLHYYTLPTNNWNAKGSSTDFGEDMWFSTLRNTRRMDTLIREHSRIMDERDPRKNVKLIVDEWGTWYDVLPGTNPGFLRQQNTLRDAIVAGINFHIFHNYADRVYMANIAQTVNVLQAMILTEDEKMIVTPTYHVFEMYKVHMDNTYLPIELETPDYTFGNESIPMIDASASRDENGRIYISLVNSDPNRGATVRTTLNGANVSSVSGRVLTAPAMNAMNTFENPNAVQPTTFDGASLSGNTLTVNMPSKSVVVLELQ